MRRRNADNLKQTEQELHKVRSWMNSAESLADIGTWIVDHQHGKLFWSDQTYRILGYDPEEITHPLELILIGSIRRLSRTFSGA